VDAGQDSYKELSSVSVEQNENLRIVIEGNESLVELLGCGLIHSISPLRTIDRDDKDGFMALQRSIRPGNWYLVDENFL
jgi:hypothetical protein